MSGNVENFGLKRALVPSSPAAGIGSYVRLLRPHHWAKNMLVFLPVILAHQVTNPYLIWWSFLAFASFCLAASATYVVNDLVDIEADRKHPTKRFRPLAAGEIKPFHAAALVPLLFGSAVALAFLMPKPWWFVLCLGCYVVLGQTYVFYLKRKLLVDVLALASLHVMRIIAGNAATGVLFSSWLLAFAMFLFFSLALLKRYSELREAGDDVGLRGVGRGYQAGDLETLSQMGISSALVSTLILALYVDSKAVSGLYSTPQLIWLICPIVLYVMARVWVLARRGQLPDDPLVFMLTDWRSLLMGAITGLIFIAASHI